ncbi:chloride peroxidase [Cladophialophora carrionii]|uniref:Chloride peroxidase n=1 Tax=Cladophialophora carrionii TaxID=86049 RepID=A0A1C1C6W1_9EURO|nr:chloride peroxidase [Cladophialophora carrionii]
MPFIHSSLDRTLLHYVDYKPAASPPRFQPTDDPAKDHRKDDVALVFIHGWPMSHQMYEHLMLPLCETYGIRCVAPDRRGFGKSEWNTSDSGDVTYDTFSQDSIDVIKSAKLERFFFVASSMGCGETLLAYLKMPGELQKQCGGFIWLGPSLPFPLATDANPKAPSRSLWDMILTGIREDRTGFTRAALPGVFGIPFNIGIEVPETVLQKFEGIVAQADALALERCVQIITNRDFTEDLTKLNGADVKLLVIHGDNDQSNPAEATAHLIPKLAKQAEVRIYEKAAHGMYLTHAGKVLEDILDVVFGK